MMCKYFNFSVIIYLFDTFFLGADIHCAHCSHKQAENCDRMQLSPKMRDLIQIHTLGRINLQVLGHNYLQINTLILFIDCYH